MRQHREPLPRVSSPAWGRDGGIKSVFADPWEPTLGHADLSTDYQTITHHRRGYGGSSPAAHERTLSEEGADAMALLDHLRIRRANVVGHSLAADIVLQAAIDAPDRFHTMTLLEPGVFTVPAAAGMDKAFRAMQQVFESEVKLCSEPSRSAA